MSETLLRLPIHVVHERFVRASLSPVDYLDAFLERIDALESRVRAFTYIEKQTLREAAQASAARYAENKPLGILDGIPIGIKDIIDTADMPTAYGSAAFPGHQPRYDAACVRALRAAGAILAGKTVTTEFAYGISGPTTNPHDVNRSPGGSSSGSAAAVGAGMLPLALGTQTLGSILRPASFNGIVGFKPSYGALSVTGIHPMAVSLDHLGVLANDVTSAWIAAAALARIAGPTPGQRPMAGANTDMPQSQQPRTLIHLRLAAWDELATAEKDTMLAMVQEVRSKGVTVLDKFNDSRVAAIESILDHALNDAAAIVDFDMRHPYSEYAAVHGERISETVRNGVARSAVMSNDRYNELLNRREAGRAAVDHLLRDTQADGFILPAASSAAPVGLAYTGSRAYLTYWSWLGFPAISVPLMQAEGLPWGLQIAHGSFQDKALIQIAQWFELNFKVTFKSHFEADIAAPDDVHAAHHDIGGDPRFARDPIPLSDGGPPDDFGRRVDALRQVLFSKKVLLGTDEFRRGIEMISKIDYDNYQYYERWLHSLRILLLEKGVVTPEELS